MSASWIRSVGVVCAAGTGLPALRAALADADWRPPLGLDRPDTSTLPIATCAAFSVKEHLPPLVARRLDRPARMLAVAVREAFRAAGEPLPWKRERIGVSAGTWTAGTEALIEVLRAVFLVSPEEAPPAQFPSTVANAAASQVAILEKLGGANLTFAEKQAGGLRAVLEAERLLARRRADAVLACGVDEAQWLHAEGYERLRSLPTGDRPGLMLGEGAAVLFLTPEPGPLAPVRLAGWASASSPAAPYRYPSDARALVTACRTAIEMADCPVDAVVSLANGSPALAALESEALLALFPGRRPAALAVTDRLGDGAFAPALRSLVATELIRGQRPAWGPPRHLVGAFPELASAPRTVLVNALAAGGSALAAVFTAG